MSQPAQRNTEIPIREAEATYSKAAKAELERDWDRAFTLYLAAAQSFLHASRTVTLPTAVKDAKARASTALERAERIKAARKAAGKDQEEFTPLARDYFSEEQQHYVLLKSSTVNGSRFPLWDSASIPGPSALYQTAAPARTVVGPLSFLPNHTPQWMHPLNAFSNALLYSSDPDGLELQPEHITQCLVEDCSLCASIQVCVAHHRRFGTSIGLDSILGRLTEANESVPLTSDGTYAVRLYLNGSWRQVVIDDTLPFFPPLPNDRAEPPRLMCMSTGDRLQMWPSLLEKAYMTLMGGYEFPGSNSCIDLHALTGWIPEHIEINSATFERERSWNRISTAFEKGHCLLTLGTSAKAATVWRDMQLLPAHCYAVVDVQDAHGQRMLRILDARVDCTQDAARSLELSWDDVCTLFEGMYVSWDPRLFGEPCVYHGIWKGKNVASNARGSTTPSSSHSLRLDLKTRRTTQNADADASIWVLLARHLVDNKRSSEYISLRVDPQEDAFPANATVSESTTLASKGRYTSSTLTLSRTIIGRTTKSLDILASFDGPYDDIGFTVTVYHPPDISVDWDRRLRRTPFHADASSALTTKNAGGNCTHPTFMLNPQYHLRIHPNKYAPKSDTQGVDKSNVSITLQGPRDLPMNITLVWCQGERVYELTRKEIAASSGPYSNGVARLARNLRVGDYTLVVSSFEAHQTGTFDLRVESSNRVELSTIPQEGAGMYCKTLRGEWDTHTAMGGPSFKNYALNPTFEVDVPESSELIVRLQLVIASISVSLNVAVFPAPPAGTSMLRLGRHIVTSGPYSDANGGVVTSKVVLSPGRYVILPSTFNPGVLKAFRLIVYTSSAVTAWPRVCS